MPPSSTWPASICDAVSKGGFDGIMLDLHGAMVTESLEDGEGELLRRIRAIDPNTPIAVSLDMHANLYDAIVDNATIVTGYRTYPHIDTYETAKRAGEILLRAIRGEIKPVMAWGNVPMLPHVMRQGIGRPSEQGIAGPRRRDERRGRAGRQPVHRLSARRHRQCRAQRRGRDRRRPRARRRPARRTARPRLGRPRGISSTRSSRWNNRVARAKSLEPPKPGEGPIVLLDHYDNCASGGTMDTTAVLAEILRQGLEDVAAFAIYDPEAVQQAIAAGIGAEVALSIGGKMAMPAIPGESRPLAVTGTVKTISNGRFRNQRADGARRPDGYGAERRARYRRAEIALISRHVEPYDLNCLFASASTRCRSAL